MGANRSIITNDGKTALQIAKDMVGFMKEVKEGIQILETFGLPGYVPWKPTPDPKATAITTVTQETTTLPRSQTSPDNPTMTNMYSPQTQDAYQVPSFQANVFVQASQPPQGSPTQYDTEPSPSPYTIPEAQGTMPLRPRFQSEPKIHRSPTSPQKPQSTGSMTPQRSQTLSQSPAQMWYPPPPPYTPPGQGNSNSQPQAQQLVIPDSPSTFSSDATHPCLLSIARSIQVCGNKGQIALHQTSRILDIPCRKCMFNNRHHKLMECSSNSRRRQLCHRHRHRRLCHLRLK
ncbi:hypothetical protein F5882DRAFT_113158 [Hyaloscypha sp. PMI_1271]|nr:hypothetical protein F5882DRAFT_113158 [Hyaloscypha sp. PMI_1271]